jgi:hypothetical protein
MEETLLLTVKSVAQAGEDLLILSALPVDEFHYSWIEKIKIVTPDNHVIEKDAEFSITFDVSPRVYILLIPNTQKDEISIGSQVWTSQSSE